MVITKWAEFLYNNHELEKSVLLLLSVKNFKKAITRLWLNEDDEKAIFLLRVCLKKEMISINEITEFKELIRKYSTMLNEACLYDINDYYSSLLNNIDH